MPERLTRDELIAEVRAARRQTETLRQLATALAEARNVDQVAMAIAERVGDAIGAAFSNVALATTDGERFRMYQPAKIGLDIGDRWVTIDADDSTPPGEAIVTGRPVHAADPDQIAEKYPATAADAAALGLRALGAQPLVIADGRASAAIGFGWTEPTAPPIPNALDPVVSLCGAALQRAWSADESQRLAALLDTLLQQAPVGFAFFDRQLRYSHVNQRLAEINGLDVAKHAGRTMEEVIPEIADQVKQVVLDVFETGEPRTGIEISGVTPASGDKRFWDVGFYPVPAPDGEILGAGVVVVEITQQRQERTKLRRSASQQRRLARQLQSGLLPTATPDVPGFAVCARYVAGTAGLRVGGDWYEIVEIQDDDYALVVGDTVGHDLEAAIAMSQVRNALTGLGHAHSDPAIVIERLDEYAANTPAVFASTLFYARLQPSTGRLRYTIAGHHPPVVRRMDGTIDHFDAPPGTPIGVTGKRETSVCELQPGDILVGYTDGLIEHRTEAIELGQQRLVETCSAVTEPSDIEALADRLLADVPNQERPDDIVLLVVRRCIDDA